jgi:hypothetical protein
MPENPTPVNILVTFGIHAIAACFTSTCKHCLGDTYSENSNITKTSEKNYPISRLMGNCHSPIAPELTTSDWSSATCSQYSPRIV